MFSSEVQFLNLLTFEFNSHLSVQIYFLGLIYCQCSILRMCHLPADSSSKVLPGLQCVVLLHIHKAAIKCVTIASGMQRLAAGDATGLVSSNSFDQTPFL